MPKLIFYAPNVYTGGGVVLLRALLSSLPSDVRLEAFLDHRARAELSVPERSLVHWVRPRVTERLTADWKLRQATRVGDTVLCFHGLPPLLPSPGHVIVFLQNRILLGLAPLSHFSVKTALRLAVERLISRGFRRNVSEYIVQTPSMARALAQWHGGSPAIRVIPFAEPQSALGDRPVAAWDFSYVADGIAHKNHQRLLEAWELLASDGIRPTLALTLGDRDQALAAKVCSTRERTGAQIFNQGHLDHQGALDLLRSSRALIFPSLGESFGLPLIEARDLNVPILASELDFVRDVCVPTETFDPLSPVSIARAVKRFLGNPETALPVQQPAQFWAALGLARNEK